MKVKYARQLEVYEFAKDLVLCQIEIVPRKVYYYHGQKDGYRSHRWMHDEDWAKFEDELESILKKSTAVEESLADAKPTIDTKFHLSSSILVHIRSLSISNYKAPVETSYKECSLVLKCKFEHVKTPRTSSKQTIGGAELDMNDNVLLKSNADKLPKEDKENKSISKDDVNVVNEDKEMGRRAKDENLTPISVKPNKKIGGDRKLGRSKKHDSSATTEDSGKKRRLNVFDNEKAALGKWLKYKKKNDCSVQIIESTSEPEMVPPSPKAEVKKRGEKKHETRAAKAARATPPKPVNYKYLTLDDMSSDDVTNSLEEFKDILDDIFKQLKDDSIVHSHNELDHYLVISLIDQRKQVVMMEKLADVYKTDHATLLANALLPEWIIRLFMRQYKVGRDEAIAQIKSQETSKINSPTNYAHKDMDPDLTLTQRVTKRKQSSV